jgi:hypothetical protein
VPGRLDRQERRRYTLPVARTIVRRRVESGRERRPLNRFGVLDSAPVAVAMVGRANARAIARVTGIGTAAARKLVAGRRRRPVRSADDLASLRLSSRDVERLRRSGLFDDDHRLVITDVRPHRERIMSDRPFTLRVSFAAGGRADARLVTVRVSWAGQPFVVERLLGARDRKAGFVDVRFARGQRLPAGPARFDVDLFSSSGAQASHRLTCAVLPSNPLSMGLSPNAHFVTGTFSARGVREGANYTTAINVTVFNGDASGVAMTGGFTWKFWDGGVGGSLVEQGNSSFGGAFTVAGHSTWGGWIVFTSPPGSGIFNKYDGREDMTIEIIMNRSGGGSIAGTITCRTMFRFGLNITRVDAEGWTNQERQDLIDATFTTRSIYEHRDVTHDIDRRLIHSADSGGFGVINSESEARDLFEQWSGPGNNIDVFIVHDIVGTGFDGLAGDIPGPTSHSGRESGVVASKSGFVDGMGQKRLHVAYLGMLIGHEVGHYLGLVHVNEAGNLMLSSSGQNDTNLNYDPQYRTIIKHGWMRID